MERAIRSLGHELVIFEDRQHMIPGRIRKLLPFLNQLDLKIINNKMVSLAEETKPDIAIVTGGHRISSDTIKTLKDLDIVCILWTIDAPLFFQPIINIAPLYNHIFCQGTEAIKLLARAGSEGAKWLPMACDPEYQHPVDCSVTDQEKYGSDIVFVGSYYPERAELFERISTFNLAIWGPGWDRLDRNSLLRQCIRGAHTTPDEWLKIYNTSKIIIATHYHDPENRFPVYQASPRVFEILACGAFQLCDDQRDVFSLLKDGEDLVKFDDTNDLINKIIYYLAHPEERKEIAAKGRQNVIENHTYVHRIKKLLSYLGCEA
ncbi:MAG: glycosyltransferase [Syntrophales bacterium]